VGKETLLQICLGVGTLLKDATLIQFNEGEYSEGTPDHIKDSAWEGVPQMEEFQGYLRELRQDVSGFIAVG